MENKFKPTSKYASNHYHVASKWVKWLELTRKVEDVIVDDERTKVVLTSTATIADYELVRLASEAMLNSCNFHLQARITGTGFEVMIYNA
jgi:hypothetical protein